MGGFGMGGPGGGGQSPYTLLAADAVAKELNLTAEQKTKIKTDQRYCPGRHAGRHGEYARPGTAGRQQKMPESRRPCGRARPTRTSTKGVLENNPTKRLKEIFVQVHGEPAFRDPEVQNALGLSDDQKAKINSPLAVLTDDQKAAFENMKGEKFDLSTLRMGGRGGFGGPGGPGGQVPAEGTAVLHPRNSRNSPTVFYGARPRPGTRGCV